MIAAIRPVQSLLLAIFMLMAGSGFLATLISLRLERAGAGTMALGAVATAYFGGLVIGALRAGGIHSCISFTWKPRRSTLRLRKWPAGGGREA